MAESAIRQEAYGEDLGQSSWLTAREWLEVDTGRTLSVERRLSRYAYLAEKPRVA